MSEDVDSDDDVSLENQQCSYEPSDRGGNIIQKHINK